MGREMKLCDGAARLNNMIKKIYLSKTKRLQLQENERIDGLH